MKKEKIRKINLFLVLIILASLVLINAQLIKSTKAQYYTGEILYVSSIVSSNDKLCRANSDAEVKIYIVENKDKWDGGEALTDIRNEASNVPNGRFSSNKVWDIDKIGNYDLVIDCNDNKNYDAGEPIYNEGFSVNARTANAVVSKGNAEISDFTWQYDKSRYRMVYSPLACSFQIS
mgnify:CR=1 FL=1